MIIPESIVISSGNMCHEDLLIYIRKVNVLLSDMKPGDSYIVEKITSEATRNLFLEVVKWYMRLNRNDYQDGLSFANGYNELRKYNLSFIKSKKK